MVKVEAVSLFVAWQSAIIAGVKTTLDEQAMEFLSTSNIMLTVPMGAQGYALSWIEAIGTLFGLLCIFLASMEKTINYLFGLINVTLFGIIFFQIQLYASLLLQIFFFIANIYGWYAWSRALPDQQAELKIRWLPLPKAVIWLVLCLMGITYMTFNTDRVFGYLAQVTVQIMQAMGLNIVLPPLEPDAFPFWDSCMMVLSVAAMLLMTRKYVESWLLWMLINVISIVIYARQGVYFMALEYLILTFVAANGALRWIRSARQYGSQPLMVSVAVES